MSADASNQCFTVGSHSFDREVLEKIAGSFTGRLRVARLNVDENAEVADAFRISSIPALKFIRGGRLLGEWTGCRTGDCLAEELLSETEIAV